MVGPITTVIPGAVAPSAHMLLIVFSIMPVAAPRHPAWQAPMIPCCSSARITGVQSAVNIASAIPSFDVTSPSA